MTTLKLIKQTATLSFLGSTILLTPLTSQALTLEEVTNPRQENESWVTDMADILSNKTETELNGMISNLEQINGTEIAVVTVPETAPATSPKAFATELFNHWGIGKAESDNGILFLISTGDKGVEIETGYGIVNILTDAQVSNIVEHKITPQYKQGNYDRGTLDGTEALISSLNSTSNLQNSSELSFKSIEQNTISPPIVKTSSSIFIFIILFIGFILYVISSNSKPSNVSGSEKNYQKNKKKHGSSSYFAGGVNDCGSSGGYFDGGASDGGSSGGDFGGGASDGGGGGGSW